MAEKISFIDHEPISKKSSRTGKYDKGTVDQIVTEAKAAGVEPHKALAVAMKETTINKGAPFVNHMLNGEDTKISQTPKFINGQNSRNVLDKEFDKTEKDILLKKNKLEQLDGVGIPLDVLPWRKNKTRIDAINDLNSSLVHLQETDALVQGVHNANYKDANIRGTMETFKFLKNKYPNDPQWALQKFNGGGVNPITKKHGSDRPYAKDAEGLMRSMKKQKQWNDLAKP